MKLTNTERCRNTYSKQYVYIYLVAGTGFGGFIGTEGLGGVDMLTFACLYVKKQEAIKGIKFDLFFKTEDVHFQQDDKVLYFLSLCCRKFE